MPYFGRRTVYILGIGTMAATLFIIGILNVWTDHKSVALGQAVLTLFWTFTFQLSVGQLGWALPAEMGSTRLRQKTVCLARNSYYIISVISGVLEPYFMNPQAWNLRGYTGFVWGGTALLTTIWAWFRLPETRGRPFGELDILFAKNVPARKFRTTQVDAFDEQDTAQLAARYSVAGGPESRRPSFIPPVTGFFSKTGKDEAFTSQRRASLASVGQRRPSIAEAVTDYLEKS
jgi:SP family general alpha glucoside:H+ symporter-like MFS transporter